MRDAPGMGCCKTRLRLLRAVRWGAGLLIAAPAASLPSRSRCYPLAAYGMASGSARLPPKQIDRRQAHPRPGHAVGGCQGDRQAGRDHGPDHHRFHPADSVPAPTPRAAAARDLRADRGRPSAAKPPVPRSTVLTMSRRTQRRGRRGCPFQSAAGTRSRRPCCRGRGWQEREGQGEPAPLSYPDDESAGSSIDSPRRSSTVITPFTAEDRGRFQAEPAASWIIWVHGKIPCRRPCDDGDGRERSAGPAGK